MSISTLNSIWFIKCYAIKSYSYNSIFDKITLTLWVWITEAMPFSSYFRVFRFFWLQKHERFVLNRMKRESIREIWNCTYMSVWFGIMVDKRTAHRVIRPTVYVSTVWAFTVCLLIQLESCVRANVFDVFCIWSTSKLGGVNEKNYKISCGFFQMTILNMINLIYHFLPPCSSLNHSNYCFGCFGIALHDIVDLGFVCSVNWPLTVNRTWMTMWAGFGSIVFVVALRKRCQWIRLWQILTGKLESTPCNWRMYCLPCVILDLDDLHHNLLKLIYFRCRCEWIKYW